MSPEQRMASQNEDSGQFDKKMNVISAESLNDCSLAEHGVHVHFSFLDGNGSGQTLEMSLECMRQLSLTLRVFAEKGLRGCNRKQGTRIYHRVAAWTAEPAPDSEGVILTFVMPDDDLPIAFQIGESGLVTLAEAVVDHELAAYPDGLRFT